MSPASREYPVCLLGAKEAGKSTFLGGLALRGAATSDSGISIHGQDSVSVEYLEELASALRRQEWPASTSRAERLSFEVGLGGRSLQLSVLDFPGGDFRDHLRKLDDARGNELKRHLRDAHAVLLLLDPAKELQHAAGLDADARIELETRLDAFLKAIAQLHRADVAPHAASADGKASARPARRPFPDVAIVVTKADSVPELAAGGDANAYLESRVPSFLKRLRDDYDVRCKAFAVSAVGATEIRDGRVVPVPHDRLRPTGYEALFQWLAHRRRVRRTWPYWMAAGVVAFVAFTAASAVQTQRSVGESSVEALLRDAALTPAERLRQSVDAPSALVPLRAALFKEALDAIDAKLSGVGGAPDDSGVDAALDELRGFQPGPADLRIEKLKAKAHALRDDSLHQQVKAAFDQQRADFGDLAALYMKQFPANLQRQAQTRAWLKDDADRRMRRAREVVGKSASESPAELRSKADAVFAFLEKYASSLDQQATERNPSEAPRMRRAAELALQFADERLYRATLVRTGDFTTPRRHLVEVECGELRQAFDMPSSPPSTSKRWDVSFDVRWSAGTPIKVSLRDDVYNLYFRSDPLVASLERKGPDALSLFTGAHVPAVQSDWTAYVKDLRFEFKTEGLAKEDWEAFADYIHPGDRWTRGPRK